MTDTALTVVVVDDDASVRRALERLLKSAGYRVESFASAQEFLARPDSGAASCLVLDVTLPGQSGLHLYDELLAHGRDIPVVFITGHDDVAVATRVLNAGAADFLSKPFEDEALLRAVARAASLSKRSQQVS